MNAIILYDTPGAAADVNALLKRASDHVDEFSHWNVKPWRLDMLIQPQIADEALKDAAEAHLMVLALRRQADMASWLMDWLEQWARRRQVTEAALAVFDDCDTGATLSTSAAPELSGFVRRHGLSFILDAAESAEVLPAGPARELHEREVVMTHVMHHIVNEPESAEAKSAACMRDLHEREVTITRTLHHILDEPGTGYSRHSGINE